MTRIRLLGLVAATLLLLAACGGDEAAVEDEPDVEAAENEAADDDNADEMDGDADDASQEDDADGAEVAVADSELGEILVDGEGLSLYLFDADEDGESTCYDDCAENWPPLATDGEPVAGEGADEALLGTTERDDGSLQVTYAGHPLYYWAGDEEPGDVNGQGIQDVWWVVEPAGEAVDGGAGDDAADGGGSAGGY